MNKFTRVNQSISDWSVELEEKHPILTGSIGFVGFMGICFVVVILAEIMGV